MDTRVAVVGVGQSSHARRRRDVDYAELALEAIEEALDDAGVALTDIEHAVTGSMDFLDGRTIASMSVAEVVGSYRKPESRIVGDAVGAVLYAWARMRGGAYRLGLIVAHAKESQGRPHIISNAAFDPFTERSLEPDEEVVSGLAAQRFHAATGLSPADAAEQVVRARALGRRHPKLEPLPQVSVDDVLGSPLLASPLRELDRAPLTDGACALVVAVADVARGLGTAPVWIAGAAVDTDDYWIDRDLSRVDALERAHRRAVGLTGWNGAVPDVVELSAAYGYQLLQFAPVFGLDLDSPGLNPSGGRLAGTPSVVAGLDGVAECTHQLRGTAGDRQLPSARQGLAHGWHGLGAQTHGVVALEAAD